jgi:hypothetical protein
LQLERILKILCSIYIIWSKIWHLY